jgi:hypothetical protein
VKAQEPKEIRPPLRSPPTLKKSTCPKNKKKTKTTHHPRGSFTKK